MVNEVLLKIDKEITKVNGFSLSTEGDVTHFMSITGTVVKAPDFLVFDKKKPKVTLDVSPTYWPKTGDKVMFSYLANVDKIPYKGDMCTIVEYGLLIGFIKDGDVFPVNGNLIVQMGELSDTEDGFRLSRNDRNDYGRGKIIYAGKPVTYSDYGIYDSELKAGMNIIFNKRFASRLEVDGFQSYNKEHQSSFFRVSGRDVLMYL